MSDNLDDIPLPEPCTIEDKLVSTRKDLVEEQDGNLFNRKCDNLDNTIPKRKDRFIECEELPDVPNVLLKNNQFNEVEFPGVPLAEIPKKLLAHLLPCCLEGRSAGFDFEIVQELNSQNKKPNIEDITQASTQQPGISQTPTVFPLSIQLGTSGYLLIGLSLKPELCFCDENCGDEDYIHIKVNLDAEYHDDDDDDVIQDPDLEITDEQLTTLISNYASDARSECSRKVFGTYTGSTSQSHYLFQPTDGSSDEIPALVAPYLHNLSIVQGGIYKLEYFCEYEDWYITDGECAENVSGYVPVHNLGIEGASEESIYGEIILPVTSAEGATVSASYNSNSSTLTEAEAFTTVPTFDVDGRSLYVNGAVIKAGADGIVVYDIVITQTTSARVYGTKVAIRVKSTDPPEEEEEEEEE